jgi:hypothetical protein
MTTKVIIFKDGDWYIGQGVDIDYAVQDNSVSEVKEQFAKMIDLNVQLNKLSGGLDTFLKPMPTDVLNKLLNRLGTALFWTYEIGTSGYSFDTTALEMVKDEIQA